MNWLVVNLEISASKELTNPMTTIKQNVINNILLSLEFSVAAMGAPSEINNIMKQLQQMFQEVEPAPSSGRISTSFTPVEFRLARLVLLCLLILLALESKKSSLG
jgi:hypothetical protein